MTETKGDFIVQTDKIPSLVPMLGAEVDNEGYIRDKETGEIFETKDGVALTIDAIGHLDESEDQRIVPVMDHFSAVVEAKSDRDIRAD